MGSSYLRLASTAWLATLTAFVVATPASAQLRGLKNKVTGKASSETENTAANAAGAQGSTIVLTGDVVNQLLTGLKAGQAEREAAAKEDTPYGRYKKGESAYAEAEPKCQAAQQTWPSRAAANQKMLDKYSALTEKMVAAQGKGDYKLMGIYQDSAMGMMDPSCVVKKPDQPKDYYEAERAVETRAEAKELKASALGQNELALVKERAIAILGNTPPPDASASEKSAVGAKASELKPLLGFRAEPAREVKTAAAPAPAAAPVPAAAQPTPEMSAAANSMSACMTKNMQTHQAEIEKLAEQGKAAQAAGDQDKLMAIAQSLQQIQMAGCTGH